MRINDIQVDGFGIWTGLTVDSLPDGMTLFYGQNEAGKTTLMQFMRTILFGFSEERRDKYIPPVHGGMAGGELHVITSQGNYQIRRHIDPNRLNDATGDLVLIDDENGTNFGRAQLASILSSIDESIFSNVFAIGLREIQELNTLNSTDAAEHLYKLTTGLDRVSLVDVMRTIRKRRQSLLAADGETKSRLDELETRRRVLQREIDELLGRARRWSRVAAQSSEAGRRLDELSDELKRLDRNGRVIEIAMNVGDRWRARRAIDQQIATFAYLPGESEVRIAELESINQKIARHRDKMSSIKTDRKSTRREAMALPVNRQLVSQAARIDAMCEHMPWIEALENQAERVRQEIEAIRTTLGGEVSGLGGKLDLKSRDVRELTNQGFASLQTSARKLLARREELESASEQIERAKADLSQYEGRMQSALVEHGSGVAHTREEAARLVTRLRRRVELEEKIEKLNASRHDLERDIDNVVNEQVLPVGKLSILGVVFVLGIVLAGFGLMILYYTGSTVGTTATEMGFLLIILGTVFGLLSMGMKHHWERIARDELDDFRHQFDLVRQQLKRSRSERDELERQLPAASAGTDIQLRDAEGELSRLEDLIPLESRYNAAIAALEESKRNHARIDRELVDLDRKWREGLRLVGMPETLSPDQLREVTQRSERIHGFHSRLDQLESEASDREKELAGLTRRIDTLLGESGIEYDVDTDPASRLQTLRVTLGQQRQLVAQRKELAARFNSLRQTYNRAARELERLEGQKSRMLAVVGADTEEKYREFAAGHAQVHKLREQRQALTDQIAAALVGHIEESLVAAELEEYGQAALEKRWEANQASIEQLREEQSHVHQQRGEYHQELKMLGEDARLDEARMELAAIEHEISLVREQWQVLAASEQVLESIRENYEQRRQPETLVEASTFLEKLTEGRYTRIWTRLTGEKLLVDNSKGETLSVEHLSRGTREAVYLGLRLALVDAYARRGAVLPLVLDDVLVNFDSSRARSAARVLRDFAESGYQVLMFTCHDHIRDLFHFLDVDVRVLPHHRDVLENNAMPILLGRADIATVEEAEIEEPDVEPVAIVPTPRRSSIWLEPAGFDPELEFELTAIREDQRRFRVDGRPFGFDERHSRADERHSRADERGIRADEIAVSHAPDDGHVHGDDQTVNSYLQEVAEHWQQSA